MSDAPGDFTLGGFNVQGQTRLRRRFENATKSLHDRLLGIVRSETDLIADLARARMAELFRNPATMQSSVSTTVVDGGSYITGSVQATGLPYLQIHEYGGVTSPHDIFPVNAKLLHFASANAVQFRDGAGTGAIEEVFTPVVHHPGSVMPERSYMRYALAQRREAIYTAFNQAARDSLDGER